LSVGYACVDVVEHVVCDIRCVLTHVDNVSEV
jgi:hypothetical protein